MLTKFSLFGFFTLATALLCSTFASADPSSGWMGFRNQTGMTLLIQETYANGRQGAAQKVFANEMIRDNPNMAGQRKFTIYSAKDPDKPIYTGNFSCPNGRENVLYILKSDGKGGVSIESVKIPLTPTPPITPPTPPKKK
jgi:hypothetical protein